MAATAALAPAPPIGLVRHIGLGLYWLGTYFVVTPVYTILLQVQISQAVVSHDTQNLVTGIATGIGGFLAMVIPPLVGHYSDRLHTRWGRRKPILVAGTLGIVLCLVFLRLAGSLPAIVVGFALVVAAINVASAAYVAVIPDTVHDAETGRASGFLGLFVQAGSVLSLITLLLMSKQHQLLNTYWILIAVLILTLLPSLWAMANAEEKRPAARAPLDIRKFLAPLWTGDFGWATFTRFLNTSAFYTTLPFLLFSFRDLLRVPDPANFTAVFELLVTATAIPFAILCGWLSDGYGRKIFVYVSGAISSLVLLFFMFGPSISPTVMLLFGVLYGIGYGTYTAVDWALCLDTLPDKANPAKDLGLFHVADALPRVGIPLLAGVVLFLFNQVQPLLGYRAIFLMAVVLYIAATVFVSRIRSVR
ncbi:MAG: MFS transporter [Candidatus Dormibacteraeota bacterium]|nr:MFS transporter [Candidatus Dormibacteraeota bacterium]